MSRSQSQRSPGTSFYDYVGGQISTIIPRFGLEQSRARIMEAYALICGSSLGYPADQRPHGFSRINYDGTPFQFAVTPGVPTPALRFLSEAAASVASGAERLRLSRDCIKKISRILHTDAALLGVSNLLDEIAPAGDSKLVADHAGAIWIGVNFASCQDPQLIIYVNAKWAKVDDAWKRLRRFTSYFGRDEEWQQIEAAVASDMQPLGFALTLSAASPPEGRVYLSSYGKLITWYEELVVSTNAFKPSLRRYAEIVLGEDRFYPLPTAVCSFGFSARADWDFKFEVCGHCIFPSDVEAAQRLRAWLESAEINETSYLEALEIVSEGCLNSAASVVHSYVGVGWKGANTYSTVYLKPHFVTAIQSNGIRKQ